MCHGSNKNNRVSLVALMYSTSGRATPGVLSQLARTRREILPSSVNKPWAGSNSYKISELMSFIAERPLSVDSPSLPFWVRFKTRLRLTPYTHPATLDTGRAANAYPRGIYPRLSSNHFQSARSRHCSHARCVLAALSFAARPHRVVLTRQTLTDRI